MTRPSSVTDRLAGAIKRRDDIKAGKNLTDVDTPDVVAHDLKILAMQISVLRKLKAAEENGDPMNGDLFDGVVAHD